MCDCKYRFSVGEVPTRGTSPSPTEMGTEAAGVNPLPTTVDTAAGEVPTRDPRPTIMDIVCAYKSLTARECKKKGFEGKLFQTSFYEHIIRNRNDYVETVKYIYEIPIRWYYDELYSAGQEL